MSGAPPNIVPILLAAGAILTGVPDAYAQLGDFAATENPCDFLSPEDVQAVTGVVVLSEMRVPTHADLRSSPARTGSICRYATDSAAGAIDLGVYSVANNPEVAEPCEARSPDALATLSQPGVRVCVSPGLAVSISVQFAVGEGWRVMIGQLAELVLQRVSAWQWNAKMNLAESASINVAPTHNCVTLPPNIALQRTCRIVTRFACAKPAPTRQAAEPGC